MRSTVGVGVRSHQIAHVEARCWMRFKFTCGTERKIMLGTEDSKEEKNERKMKKKREEIRSSVQTWQIRGSYFSPCESYTPLGRNPKGFIPVYKKGELKTYIITGHKSPLRMRRVYAVSKPRWPLAH
ncbi:jg7549 [Pararge aegeria aegeria]|uniref:Jg7549 protein n=1 Tax=Pararge aegeria aegeria TaxID=348720 RepID=A0A8S4S7J8_9NEOP|nr:jg7549 [Pararge aegeria aegeria]